MANDLLKEAIADAKAVRETALANAKIALEEAFTPRLQSMLSAKLAEEEGLEDEPELEAEPVAPEPEMEDPVAMEARGMMDADEDPTDVHSEEMAPEDEFAGQDEDLELEAIIRELETEMYNEAEGEEAEADLEEVSSSTALGNGEGQSPKKASSSDQDDPGKGKLKEEADGDDDPVANEGRGDKDVDEDISIDEIINALREEEGGDDDKEEKVDEAQDTAGVDDGAAKKDLDEAYNVIRFLKSKINEVNLLNAKLLFSNKLFKNHSMNESQKMKVIENFDRASTIREVKLVFATLSEGFALTSTSKRTIKESYASKPSRSTAPNKKVISEGNDLTARWRKLANL